MSVSYVGTIAACEGSTTALTTTWSGDQPRTAGDTLFAVVFAANASTTPPTCSTPSGWTLDTSASDVSYSPSASAKAWLFRKTAAGGDAAPSFTIGNCTIPTRGALLEVAGLNTSSPVDVAFTPGSATSSTTVHAGPNTTTNPDDFVLAAMVQYGSSPGSHTWTAPLVGQVSKTAASNVGYSIASVEITTAQSVTPTDTVSSSAVALAMLAVAYKAASGAVVPVTAAGAVTATGSASPVQQRPVTAAGTVTATATANGSRTTPAAATGQVTTAGAVDATVLAAVTQRINLCTNPNFDTDLTGWVPNQATLTRDTSRSFSGAASCKITGLNAAMAPYMGYLPVVGGAWYLARCQLSIDTQLAHQFVLAVSWYDAGHVYLGVSANVFDSGAPTGGGWREVHWVAQAPANAAFVLLYTAENISMPSSDNYWIDNVQLEQVPGNVNPADYPYFDGDTPPAPPVTYWWEGTPRASRSLAKTVPQLVSAAAAGQVTAVGATTGKNTTNGVAAGKVTAFGTASAHAGNGQLLMRVAGQPTPVGAFIRRSGAPVSAAFSINTPH